MKDFKYLAELPGTPQEEEWMRERLDTLSVKESIVLAAALDGDPPSMASDAICQLCALSDYKICGYAGDYKQLGEYAANEAMLSKDVRPHLNLEKLGHTYAENHPGKFCEEHYVEFPDQPSTQRYDPQNGQLPEDTDWSVKLKVATPEKPEGVWIRLPDHQGDMDNNPDEISLALDALHVKNIQELTVLDTRCVLPGTWNLTEQYSDVADLMYDANDLGLVLESQCQRSDCFKEFLRAALEYENCQDLRLALEIARNPEFYDWISSDSLEEIAKKELRDQGVSEKIIGSDAIDLKAYGEEILIRNGYVPASDQTGYIFSHSHDGISQDNSPKAPEMQM